MSRPDHRTLAVPLFVLGSVALVAGAMALAAEAFLDIPSNNAIGAMGGGVVFLFSAFALTILLNPHSDLGANAARASGGAGALAIVLLLAVVASGAAIPAASVADAPGGGLGGVASEGAGAAEGLLGSEDFAGTLQGTSTPLGGLGGATSSEHALDAPEGATAARLELDWSTGAAGATSLALRVLDADGAVLDSASGGPGLVLDAKVLPARARVVVELPEGAAAASTSYALVVSYFAGAIPADFTAQ